MKNTFLFAAVLLCAATALPTASAGALRGHNAPGRSLWSAMKHSTQCTAGPPGFRQYDKMQKNFDDINALKPAIALVHDMIKAEVARVGLSFKHTNAGHFCANRMWGVTTQADSLKQCAEWTKHNEKCGTGFSYAGPAFKHCDCSPKGQTCTLGNDANFNVYEIATLPAMRPITRFTSEKDDNIVECKAKCDSDARCESFVVEVKGVVSTCSFRKVTAPAWLAEAEAMENLLPVFKMLRKHNAYGEFTEAFARNGSKVFTAVEQQHKAFATSTLYADEGEPNKEYLSALHRYAEVLELQFNTTHDELVGNPCMKAVDDIEKESEHLRKGLQWLYKHAACPVIKKAVHYVVKEAKSYAEDEIDEMCGEMAVELSAACEIVGMGPEDPLADTCVAVFGYMGEECAKEGKKLVEKYADIGANDFIKMVDCA